jgi:hypothetical protein
MWAIDQNEFSTSTSLYRVRHPDDSFVSFQEAISLWSADSPDGNVFRLFTSLAIASAKFQAFRFETPPLKISCMDRPFEFAIIDSPGLDRVENPRPFLEQFETGQSTKPSTVTFSNLTNSAVLIAPTPTDVKDVNHCHLGSYLRTADQAAGMDLWKATGIALQNRLSDKPVWLNTAGGGVAWLHIRLDDQPKYYRHSAYKIAP